MAAVIYVYSKKKERKESSYLKRLQQGLTTKLFRRQSYLVIKISKMHDLMIKYFILKMLIRWLSCQLLLSGGTEPITAFDVADVVVAQWPVFDRRFQDYVSLFFGLCF